MTLGASILILINLILLAALVFASRSGMIKMLPPTANEGLLMKSGRQALRFLGIDGPGLAKRTAGLAERGSSAHEMAGGILDLETVVVGEVMTHRKSAEMLDADLPFDEAVRQVKASPYTRFPLYLGEPDEIIGVVHAKDLLSRAHERRSGEFAPDLALLATPPWFVPETTTLFRQLSAFRQRKEHLAIVVDEYGDIQGLVTLEDILEEIVGEIEDEKDVAPGGIKQQSDGSWLIDGGVTVRDINRQFGWILADEEASTMAGLVINHAGRIPAIGQSFELGPCAIEIVRHKGHQLKTMRLRVLPPSVPADE